MKRGGEQEENLESKIERQWGIITKNAGNVAAPKRENTLIFGNSHNAIHQTLVACMLAMHDSHIAVLRLEQQLGPLYGRHQGVRHSSQDGSDHQIPWEIAPCFLRHLLLLLLLLLLSSLLFLFLCLPSFLNSYCCLQACCYCTIGRKKRRKRRGTRALGRRSFWDLWTAKGGGGSCSSRRLVATAPCTQHLHFLHWWAHSFAKAHETKPHQNKHTHAKHKRRAERSQKEFSVKFLVSPKWRSSIRDLARFGYKLNMKVKFCKREPYLFFLHPDKWKCIQLCSRISFSMRRYTRHHNFLEEEIAARSKRFYAGKEFFFLIFDCWYIKGGVWCLDEMSWQIYLNADKTSWDGHP